MHPPQRGRRIPMFPQTRATARLQEWRSACKTPSGAPSTLLPAPVNGSTEQHADENKSVRSSKVDSKQTK